MSSLTDSLINLLKLCLRHYDILSVTEHVLVQALFRNTPRKPSSSPFFNPYVRSLVATLASKVYRGGYETIVIRVAEKTQGLN
jgi:hypothetical protein